MRFGLACSLALVIACAQIPLSAGDKIDPKFVGSIDIEGAWRIAVDPMLARAYVISNRSDRVSVINTITNTVEGEIVLGFDDGDPRDVAVNPITRRIYVSEGVGGTVYVIDGATNNVASTISTRDNPSVLAVDVVRNRVFVFAGHRLQVINGATNVIEATIRVDGIAALAVSHRYNLVYTGRFISRGHIIDAGINEWVGSLPLVACRGVAYSEATNRVWLVGTVPGGSQLNVVDASSNTVIETLAFQSSRAFTVALDPRSERAYVPRSKETSSGLFENRLSVIDGRSNELLTTVSLPDGEPSCVFDVAVDPLSKRVYVADLCMGRVYVVEE